MTDVKRWFRIQDLAWIIFVVILIATGPETNYQNLILLPLIGAFQIVEPRLKIFASQRGQVLSVALKMIFSYLFFDWRKRI